MLVGCCVDASTSCRLPPLCPLLSSLPPPPSPLSWQRPPSPSLSTMTVTKKTMACGSHCCDHHRRRCRPPSMAGCCVAHSVTRCCSPPPPPPPSSPLLCCVTLGEGACARRGAINKIGDECPYKNMNVQAFDPVRWWQLDPLGKLVCRGGGPVGWILCSGGGERRSTALGVKKVEEQSTCPSFYLVCIL